MPNDIGYKIRDNQQMHFVTFAVTEWVDVFTRKQYADIIVESLQYCQTNKGLELFAWCLMSNHLHLIISVPKQEITISDILRDFKKFTSKKIIEAIIDNPKESRKEWMLAIFKKAGEANVRNKNYQFWRQDNHPIEIFSLKFIAQKLNYIHQNPVLASIVDNAADFVYSSARDYAHTKKGLLDIIYA